MPTKPTTGIRSATSQRDNRWVATVYDQHKSARFPRGRPWWGHLEYPADRQHDPAFTCELIPGDHNDPFNSSWSAPWLPSQMSVHGGRGYFRLDYKRLTLTWTYQSIIEDDKAANLRYYEAAAKIAHANGWKAPGLNEPVGFQLESILLSPPRSHKIAEAALAGDPWILGHTTQENVALRDLLRGIRVHNERQPVVTPEQVLAGGPDIEAIVARAVAAALEAEKAKNRKRMAPARAARGKRSPSAEPKAA